MSLEKLMEYLLGPFGSLVLLIVFISFLYRIFVTKIIPLIEQVATRHLNQIDRMVTSHDEDREMFREEFSRIHAKVNTVEIKLDTAFHTLKNKV